jgi:hypothetical protein
MSAPDPRVVSTTGMPADRDPDHADHPGLPAYPMNASVDARPYDPLKLCIFATIALLGWLTGPAALLVFAVVGFAGYLRARRAGLRFSRCFLRDTRLVLVYLGVLAALAGWGLWERLS